MNQWYYSQDDQQQGPVDDAQIKAMIQSGQLQPTTLVWKEGMADWAAISTVPELASAQPATPQLAAPAAQPAQPAAASATGGFSLGQSPLAQQATGQTASAATTNPYGAPTAQPSNFNSTADEVDAASIDMLRRTKGWVQFVSILTFIGVLFMLLGSLGMFMIHPIAGILYLLMAALYFYPGLKLWQYGSGIGDLMRTRSAITLATALDKQRAFWKFTGILILITIVISIVIPIIMAAAVATQMPMNY